MENKEKLNPLMFPLICVTICWFIYFIAFHETRDENKELKIKLEKCKNN